MPSLCQAGAWRSALASGSGASVSISAIMEQKEYDSPAPKSGEYDSPAPKFGQPLQRFNPLHRKSVEINPDTPNANSQPDKATGLSRLSQTGLQPPSPASITSQQQFAVLLIQPPGFVVRGSHRHGHSEARLHGEISRFCRSIHGHHRGKCYALSN